MKLKRSLFQVAGFVGAAAMLMVLGCGFPGVIPTLDRGQAVQISQSYVSGYTGEYFYSCWIQQGTGGVTFNKGDGGHYSVTWQNCGNFTCGKGLTIGGTDTILSYAGSFNGGSAGYLALYGWMYNPAIEYYVLENTTYNPAAGATSLGNFTCDGSVYDLYKSTRVNQPWVFGGIDGNGGNGTFDQYWSVRRSKRSSGTITFINHFNKWKEKGMPATVTFNEKCYQVMETEGINSSGSSDITVSFGNPDVTAPWTPHLIGTASDWIDISAPYYSFHGYRITLTWDTIFSGRTLKGVWDNRKPAYIDFYLNGRYVAGCSTNGTAMMYCATTHGLTFTIRVRDSAGNYSAFSNPYNF